MTDMVTTNSSQTSGIVTQGTSATSGSLSSTPLNTRMAMRAAFAELAETACELRNSNLEAANTQTVNSWDQQVSSFNKQRESASKMMKSSLLAGAGEVIGGAISTALSIGGPQIAKGVSKTERNARRAVQEEAKNLSGESLNSFMKLNEKKLTPHRNFEILGQCSPAIGQLVSQPFSIAGSVIGSGAKKLDSVAEFDKFISNNAQKDAKQYEEAGKSISNRIASAAKMAESFNEGITRALSAAAA